jgi:hypothetical protein
MESFFLSETLKYLYLLFDQDNIAHRAPHVFSTEAHLMPLRAEWMVDSASGDETDLLSMHRTQCPVPTFDDVIGPYGFAPSHEEPINQLPQPKNVDSTTSAAPLATDLHAPIDIAALVPAAQSHAQSGEIARYWYY